MKSGGRRTPRDADAPVFFTGPQMAERYLHNLKRILRRASQPGPYVYIVGSDGVEKRWPKR